MGHPTRNMEDCSDEGDKNYGSPSREVSEVKNISKCSRDHPCNILAKNVTAFCPCPKSLLEPKLKNFGLMALAEISRQPSIDFVS